MKKGLVFWVLLPVFLFGSCIKTTAPSNVNYPISSIPPEAIKILPNPSSAYTREEFEKVALNLSFVDEKTFAATLTESIYNASKFSSGGSIELSAQYNSHEIRNSDISDLHSFIRARIITSPAFYKDEDIFGYESFYMVWQYKDFFKLVRLHQGNDNQGIRMEIGRGNFLKNDFWRARNPLIITEMDYMESIRKFEGGDQSIFPHIELYKVCLPNCDQNGLFGIEENILAEMESSGRS